MNYKKHLKKITNQRVMNEFLPQHECAGIENGKSTRMLIEKFMVEDGMFKLYNKDYEFRSYVNKRVSEKIGDLKNPKTKWYLKGFDGRSISGMGKGQTHFFPRNETEFNDSVSVKKMGLNNRKARLSIILKDIADNLMIKCETNLLGNGDK